MSIIAWLLLGLLAGVIASKIIDNTGKGIVGDIMVGILGALIGGFTFNTLGAYGVDGLYRSSLLVATFGSVVLLLAYYAIRRPAWRGPPL